MKQYFLAIIFTVCAISVISNSGNQFNYEEFIEKNQTADKAQLLLDSLSLEEKIGQLIMINAYTDEKENDEELVKFIKNYHVGGVLFFQGSPYKQAKLTNKLQSISNIPLFIAMDAEWGISMRMDSVLNFPRQMTLGAIQNNELIYQMGKEVAYQCQRIGVHINFAPVIDININPKNPIIHLRSFGENRELVTQKGLAYMRGMQDNNVMAVAKHFPGHGDTDVDSHKDLPVISKSIEDLERNELYPFYKLVKGGVEGIMVAHLYVPAIDKNNKLPTSISENAINKLLVNDIGFSGLIFTDALNMKGVSRDFKSGIKEVKALQAGNDILLFPEDIEKAVSAIKKSIAKGLISEELINYKVKKVLISKINHGLFAEKKIILENLTSDLNNSRTRLLKRQLAEKAVTLVKNDSLTIPFINLENRHIAAINFGGDSNNDFHEHLQLYTQINTFSYPASCNYELLNKLEHIVNKYNTLIISIQDVAKYNIRNFNIDPRVIHFINSVAKEKNVILVNFGSPYALKYFDKVQTILQIGEQDIEFQQVAAQALFGGIPITGKLPVTVNTSIPYGSGISIKKAIRLKYSTPDELNFSTKSIAFIEKIID